MIFRCILMNMNIPTSKNPILQEKNNTPLLLLGIVFILTIGTSLLPASWFGIQQQTRRYEPLNLGNLAQPENLATDTNNDGAISWGELIASSLSISEDEIETKTEIDPKEIAILNDQNNLTASFTKNAYIAGTTLLQNNILGEQESQQVMRQLLQDEVGKIVPKTYTPQDIQVVATNKTTIKNYGNETATILKGIITKESIVRDMTSLSNYLGTADSSALIPLIENGKKADAVLTKLLALKVPSSATIYHLQTLIRVSDYRDTLFNLSSADTDGVRATAALKKYQDTVTEALQIFPTLEMYFSSENVVFSSTEPGYLYIVGYTGITQ